MGKESQKVETAPEGDDAGQHALTKKEYRKELRRLQVELDKLQLRAWR